MTMNVRRQLMKNNTGKSTSSVMLSSSVPNTCCVRNVRTFQICPSLPLIRPVGTRSKYDIFKLSSLSKMKRLMRPSMREVTSMIK